MKRVPIAVVPPILERLDDVIGCLLPECLLLLDEDETVDVALSIGVTAGDTTEQDDTADVFQFGSESALEITDRPVEFGLIVITVPIYRYDRTK
nr:hypothetical protein [Halapricum hydrolyticum]